MTEQFFDVPKLTEEESWEKFREIASRPNGKVIVATDIWDKIFSECENSKYRTQLAKLKFIKIEHCRWLEPGTMLK